MMKACGHRKDPIEKAIDDSVNLRSKKISTCHRYKSDTASNVSLARLE